MSELAMNTYNESMTLTHISDYEKPIFVIDEVNLEFILEAEHTQVTSILKVRRNEHANEDSHDLILQGEELTLLSLKLNDTPMQENEYILKEDRLVILDVPNEFQLEIVIKINPAANTQLSGLYYFEGTFCTQCEAEGFRRITYFLDRPDILARYRTTIIADEKKFPHLLSNGNLLETGQLEHGKHYAKWEDPFKKPSYLFALVAGDFDVRTDTFKTQSGRNVDLRMYVEKGYGDQTQFAFQALKDAMLWDEKTYGREYDLDIYMIVAISDFNMGAMENKGLNIFNTKFLLAEPSTATDDDYIHILSVIGHEYFHNWSGNRVTCRDWFQLSLKEGLTIFRDQTFTEDMVSPTAMRIKDVHYLRETQFIEDAGPLAHPVMPDSYIEINNFYTSTIYNKGAEVLRMLRTIIGEKTFREGMDLYFSRFDGQAATIEDFIQTMEEVSGLNLKQFRLWYHQAGTPVVNVTDEYDGSNKTYTLTLTQSTPPTPKQEKKDALFIPIKIGLINQEGDPILLYTGEKSAVPELTLNLREESQSFKFTDVLSKPIPSLLRDFSAPIQIHYPYADEDLITLFKYDPNAFNRYEAGQKYTLQVLETLIKDHQLQHALKVPSELIEMFAYSLTETEDRFLVAEMLALPSEGYIGEQMEVVKVNAIHEIREYVLKTLARELHTLFKETYDKNQSAEKYTFNLQEIGRRQLKNKCLFYLLQLEENAEIGMSQFQTYLDTNMTNTQAALAALANLETPFRHQALKDFYEKWKNNELVMDKWFSIQAASKLPNTLQNIKKLMRHESFNIKNPNKVYALIGTFAYRNPVCFHAEDGEGYAFLRDTVQQLDKLNPQVAARMVKPLTNWHRYDKERQELMREQLEVLLADKKISRDVYELVAMSLNKG